MANSRQTTAFKELLENEGLISVNHKAIDYAVEFIRNEFDPEDIFSETQLEKWAEANGYVKATENE